MNQNSTDLSALKISDKEFKMIASLVYEKIGIHLPDNKRTLVVGRLRKYLLTHQFSFTDFYHKVLSDKTGGMLKELTNMITTNHTFFNRESIHFDFFHKTALPEIDMEMKKKGQNDLRIWCAASSTGEEPIMIKLKMLQYFGMRYSSLTAGMLATDISGKALALAKAGVYPKDQFKDLDATIIAKHFSEKSKDKFEVKREIIKDIHYGKFNLVTGHYRFKQPFHAIFCRNVMIYFDEPTKEKVVNSLYDVLKPGGYLFIGHAESLNKLNHSFKYVQPALYRKP